MPPSKVYNIRLVSTDRLDSATSLHNNATYNLNLSLLLPREVEYWNVQLYFRTDDGYYTGQVAADNSITTDLTKGHVVVNGLRTLNLSSGSNCQNGYMGSILRQSSTQTYHTNAPNNPQVAYYVADNSHNPPVTVTKPADALLNVTIWNDYDNVNKIPLVNTDNQGVAVGDMTGYSMILSFTEVQDYKQTATMPPKR